MRTVEPACLLVREMHLYQTLCDQANLRRGTYWRYVTACVRRLMKPPITQLGTASGPEKNLLVTFHGESEGGIKLSDHRASGGQLREHGNVLEVIYHLLGFGV